MRVLCGEELRLRDCKSFIFLSLDEMSEVSSLLLFLFFTLCLLILMIKVFLCVLDVLLPFGIYLLLSCICGCEDLKFKIGFKSNFYINIVNVFLSLEFWERLKSWQQGIKFAFGWGRRTLRYEACVFALNPIKH